jgi:hypothetical protein
MHHLGSAICIAAFCAATTSASAESSSLPILKEFEFQAGMARLIADQCEGLEFDDNARRIHFLHMDQELIAIGVNPSTAGVRFSEADFAELNQAFAARHGIDHETTRDEFCAAAELERTEETAIGKMLSRSE